MINLQYASGHLLFDKLLQVIGVRGLPVSTVRGLPVSTHASDHLVFNQLTFTFGPNTFNDDTSSSLGVFHDDKLFPIKPELMIDTS